ncbi:hypothetical protein K435DRAFT_802009 [Dendrothele bispora CBS 962.96]|uniref:Uncharacterized protein n=1 Tax=Dendrothele bispora (strain CBS 962.96) TaxID=1314807 RepID=A0A4S8LMD4_DENBC|nr:hypothetical protein K435DRAFT_802009 [Dendrothele bispora CBS 962.96]
MVKPKGLTTAQIPKECADHQKHDLEAQKAQLELSSVMGLCRAERPNSSELGLGLGNVKVKILVSYIKCYAEWATGMQRQRYIINRSTFERKAYRSGVARTAEDRGDKQEETAPLPMVTSIRKR